MRKLCSCTLLTISLTARERATISLFVLSGNELRAAMTFDGPIPETVPISTGADLLAASQKLDEGMFGRAEITVHEKANIDFEHLNIGPVDDDVDDSMEEEIPENESVEDRRARRARQRKKALEARQKRDQRRIEQRERVRDEGEPYEQTIRANGSGWYRYCVKGTTWHQVNVEIDLRKESEMGGVGEGGHVLTYLEKAVAEDEEYLQEDTAESEGIKDEDFQSTRDKLKTLRRLIADIQSRQSQERHRLLVHAATNEHSHARMVISSLVQTLLFMAVTGYQVYTIRKWFRGAPVLGR